jgi:hypothetical protein
MRCESLVLRPLVVGDAVRDWRITPTDSALFPYAENQLVSLEDMPQAARWLWPTRTTMGNRATFAQKTYFAEGRPWWEWHQVALERLSGWTITFGEVATHNHFVLDRGGKVFKQTAPVIKLGPKASSADHFGFLGFLNSSTACFWLKQVCHNKGATVDDRGARQRTDPFEDFYQFNATRVGQFPLAVSKPIDISKALIATAEHLSVNLPAAVVGRATPERAALKDARTAAEEARTRMIALQEELDWRCYRLYGLLPDAPEHPDPPPLRLGERAFEIAMVRQIAAGELETAWFERHRSTPITEIPEHWPASYRAIVERRIEIIESDPSIGLIERPEYKRRWSMESWEDMERQALRGWLLDRLEDPRFWPAGDPRLISTRQLADAARRDSDFLSAAALYAGFDVDVEVLVAELVAREAVPFLSALRYTESGLRKRAQWEETWDKQRREDAIDAEVEARRDEFLWTVAARLHPRGEGEAAEAWSSRLAAVMATPEIRTRADRLIAEEQRRRENEEIGNIPVPPKYQKADFLNQDYWRLRGGLDVPKERFVSFPRCERDADGSLVATWAGYDHLARARAIAAYYIERKETDGWEPPRLVPLLAGLGELLPWLRQWHNEYDPAMGVRMGDYFSEFVRDEARSLGMTEADLAAWAPPAAPRRARSRRTAA